MVFAPRFLKLPGWNTYEKYLADMETLLTGAPVP
jgi:hypothetical protein